MKSVCFLLMTFTPVSFGWTTCKDGWLAFQGSCYYFGHSAVDFTEAEHYCRQHTSHLIHVEAETENSFIKARLRELHNDLWWLGLTDEEVTGHWKWFDTDTLAEYLDWATDEPDLGSEECGIFWNSADFKWGDMLCTRVAFPICEMPGNDAGSNSLIG